MDTFAMLTTLRAGGAVREMVHGCTAEEIVTAVRGADGSETLLLLLAGGSNLLVSDAGFDGRVVRIETSGVRAKRDGDSVVLDVQAGEPWDRLVEYTVANGFSGFECLSGIPGSTGATPVQNVGAYGAEVASMFESLVAYDRTLREVVTLGAGECGFVYRGSNFKRRDRYVILSVGYRLQIANASQPIRYGELARVLDVEVGATAPLAEVRSAVLALRKGKGMVLDDNDVDTRSAGSFFTNPILAADQFRELEARFPEATIPAWLEPSGSVKTSAAWLIERAGFTRGYELGPVRLSTKHALALTNPGNGTAADLVALAREVRDGVRKECGVTLEPEPVLVGIEL